MSAPNRFDYVAYDDEAKKKQAAFKESFMALEKMVNEHLQLGRYSALVHTKLEEAYMYVGKSIRDDQIDRNGSAELQEARGDS